MVKSAGNARRSGGAVARQPSKKDLGKKRGKAADSGKGSSKKARKKSSSEDSSSTSSSEEEPMWTQQEMQQFRMVAAGFGLLLACI